MTTGEKFDSEVYVDENNEVKVIKSDAEYNVSNSSMHRCSIAKSINQLIPQNIWTTLTFDLEEYDVGGMHDNITNNTRLTIKTAGEYLINYHIKTEIDDKMTFESRLIKNGVVLEGTCDLKVGSKDVSHSVLQNTSCLQTFVVNDYIELQVYQDNSTSHNVMLDNTCFTIKRIY